MREDGIVIGLALVLFASALSTQANAALISTSSSRASTATRVEHRNFILGRGETLDLVLARAGVAPDQRQAAERAFRNTHDPRHLKIGESIVLTFARDNDGNPRLLAVHVDLTKNADLTLVARQNGSFHSAAQKTNDLRAEQEPAPSAMRSITGVVTSNFQRSLQTAGLSSQIIHEVHEALIYDQDLPDNPPVGSRFQIIYESEAAPASADGNDALHCASITIHGREHSVYRYPVGNGLIAFVEPDGRGVLQARLATPVPDARISSPWGWRIHPVLNRPEFHKGIDIAAPAGTPVLAAADGTIEFVGRHGNYGLLIRLEHTNELTTTYGHLQRFAKGLHVGSHIVRGQKIGYVGETGLATGPHLYYEVFVSGERVNPINHHLAVPIHLAGPDLQRFEHFVLADAQ